MLNAQYLYFYKHLFKKEHDETERFPQKYALYQNFPQLFYRVTRIGFDLPEKSKIKLIVYDTFGREYKTLIDDELNSGSYEIKWVALNAPPGVYYYKVFAGDYVDSKKMILVKDLN